ncbi:hypothetical protein WR25_20080 [Diploscapter pachys]|uniref:Uncharacterized protein n=1 Tax=Diploscapter pachys TaxID=2018661 RepID=A0A2A2KK19_9BILA|nr:hypothetical protein WR25_20080 [Diploscapter pachys]
MERQSVQRYATPFKNEAGSCDKAPKSTSKGKSLWRRFTEVFSGKDEPISAEYLEYLVAKIDARERTSMAVQSSRQQLVEQRATEPIALPAVPSATTTSAENEPSAKDDSSFYDFDEVEAARGSPNGSAASRSKRSRAEDSSVSLQPPSRRRAVEEIANASDSISYGVGTSAGTAPRKMQRITRSMHAAVEHGLNVSFEENEEEDSDDEPLAPKLDHYKSGKRHVKVKGEAAVDQECEQKIDTAHVYQEDGQSYDAMLRQHLVPLGPRRFEGSEPASASPRFGSSQEMLHEEVPR